MVVDISNVPKNDGAKVYNILEYLRKVPMHQPVTIRDIFQHTGVVCACYIFEVDHYEHL